MIFYLFALLLASSSTNDAKFHLWCESVGINVHPAVHLETTSASIAGRGIIVSDDLKKGDVTISTPEITVLHEFNAAYCFPEVARKLHRRYRIHSFKNYISKLFGFDANSDKECDDDYLNADLPKSLWQAELTSYALAAIEENHAWSAWISQWKRDDPVQRLFDGAEDDSLTDEKAISIAIGELSAMAPDVSPIKIRAAINMQINRFRKLKKIYQLKDSSAALYATLSSRAIRLGDITAVIPMLDMINHSMDPNLELRFDGEKFELFANRFIKEGEELFICYDTKEVDDEWDEDAALWTLMQWGIPTPKPSSVIH